MTWAAADLFAGKLSSSYMAQHGSCSWMCLAERVLSTQPAAVSTCCSLGTIDSSARCRAFQWRYMDYMGL